jgi:hypothetical protein
MFNPMTKGAKRRIRRKEFAGREPTVITGSVILLGVLVLTCAAMLVPPLWTAVVENRQFRPSDQDCSALKDAAARQACFEEQGKFAAPHPAKGANAPPSLRPSGQRSE